MLKKGHQCREDCFRLLEANVRRDCEMTYFGIIVNAQTRVALGVSGATSNLDHLAAGLSILIVSWHWLCEVTSDSMQLVRFFSHFPALTADRIRSNLNPGPCSWL
jgi:hypothetical protein